MKNVQISDLIVGGRAEPESPSLIPSDHSIVGILARNPTEIPGASRRKTSPFVIRNNWVPILRFNHP